MNQLYALVLLFWLVFCLLKGITGLFHLWTQVWGRPLSWFSMAIILLLGVLWIALVALLALAVHERTGASPWAGLTMLVAVLPALAHWLPARAGAGDRAA